MFNSKRAEDLIFGRNEWDIFDVVVIINVASFYCDKLELKAASFNDYERNNLIFWCFWITYVIIFRFSYWF
jgi:hypothetical protein